MRSPLDQRIATARGRVAVNSRRCGNRDKLHAARLDLIEALTERAVLDAVAAEPALPYERRARLAALLLDGDAA